MLDQKTLDALGLKSVSWPVLVPALSPTSPGLVPEPPSLQPPWQQQAEEERKREAALAWELAKIEEIEDASVRAAAVGKVTDEDLLAKIAVEDKDATVRSAADGTLKSLRIARAAAVKELSDQASLAKIALEDKDAGVREAAEVRLAVLQTANLSASERARANWAKLRKGMSYSTVRKLIGPFPQEIESDVAKSGYLGARESGPIATPNSLSFETNLYVLIFNHLTLIYFQLK
jgi:hypothetical protein